MDIAHITARFLCESMRRFRDLRERFPRLRKIFILRNLQYRFFASPFSENSIIKELKL